MPRSCSQALLCASSLAQKSAAERPVTVRGAAGVCPGPAPAWPHRHLHLPQSAPAFAPASVAPLQSHLPLMLCSAGLLSCLVVTLPLVPAGPGEDDQHAVGSQHAGPAVPQVGAGPDPCPPDARWQPRQEGEERPASCQAGRPGAGRVLEAETHARRHAEKGWACADESSLWAPRGAPSCVQAPNKALTAINITRFIRNTLKLKRDDAVVVKMDIERAEWDVLPGQRLPRSPLAFSCSCRVYPLSGPLLLGMGSRPGTQDTGLAPSLCIPLLPCTRWVQCGWRTVRCRTLWTISSWRCTTSTKPCSSSTGKGAHRGTRRKGSSRSCARRASSCIPGPDLWALRKTPKSRGNVTMRVSAIEHHFQCHGCCLTRW